VGIAASPAVMAHVKSELHLDVPAYQQYWIFVWNIIRHQSLGYSFQYGASVRWIVAQDARVTGSLIFGAMFFFLLLAIPIGIISALRPRSLYDRFAMVFILMGISVPPVWLGLILAYVFGFRLGWTPIADYCNFVPHSAGECSGPVRWAYHLILPWATMTFLYAALYARFIRASMLEVSGEDYIRTAFAKGAGGRRVVVHHLLRNSMLPIVTMLGMTFTLALGSSAASALFIEQVFNLHGLGAELVSATRTSDIPVVVGVIVFISLVVIICNFVVDVAYAWLDPRIRLE
jgi:peptide/nickel transport system permease protein